MNMIYKIYEIVDHKLFEEREGPYYSETIIKGYYLKQIELPYDVNEFIVFEEAHLYINKNKDKFRGKNLTIIPIIEIGFID